LPPCHMTSKEEVPSWYYASKGKQKGPATETYLQEEIDRGEITIDTLVWRKGMPSWKKIKHTPMIEKMRKRPKFATLASASVRLPKVSPRPACFTHPAV